MWLPHRAFLDFRKATGVEEGLRLGKGGETWRHDAYI